MSQRVLITGATGFVGRALICRLGLDNARIAVVTRKNLDHRNAKHTAITWNGDPDDLVRQTIEFNPDVVYHLATHFIAQHTTRDIPELIDSNVTLGTAVLEASTISGARVVMTGSAWQHYAGEAYHPVSLYAATKQALLDIAVFYADEGLDVRELTLFDTYGPGDTRRKLVPLLLEAAASSSPIIMSSGQQFIDLLYVSDVVDALLRAAVLPSNTASGVQRYVARSTNPVTIRDLVHVVEQTVGRSIAIDWGQRPYRPKEMMSPWVFGSELPDWTPAVGLSEGLAWCWNALLEGGAK